MAQGGSGMGVGGASGLTEQVAEILDKYPGGIKLVDSIEFFTNISDGEFFEGTHHLPHSPGRRCYFCPDYPISFFLKSFLNGYR